MATNKRIRICQNHLVDLYEALKRGDVGKVEKVEHLLTPAEECVACAYLFKNSGTVRDALESYLQKEGFDVEAEKKNYFNLKFLISRAVAFIAIFVIVFFLETIFVRIVFGREILLFQLNIIELTFISVVSISLFVIVDDFLFE
ncbi:MAG: hypothetical protein UT57_C0055G0007 [Microgenomates group bacterium GW2011_GWC1_39_7]|nr:MAG: hypothetical protein UT57_C0055G0007 [Microgenomates group bacterium GW2011_GWC1_39_7]